MRRNAFDTHKRCAHTANGKMPFCGPHDGWFAHATRKQKIIVAYKVNFLWCLLSKSSIRVAATIINNNIVVIYYAFHSNGYYYCYQYRSLCFCGRRNLYSHAYIFSCNGTRLSNEKFQRWRYEERTFDSNVVWFFTEKIDVMLDFLMDGATKEVAYFELLVLLISIIVSAKRK